MKIQMANTEINLLWKMCGVCVFYASLFFYIFVLLYLNHRNMNEMDYGFIVYINSINLYLLKRMENLIETVGPIIYNFLISSPNPTDDVVFDLIILVF